MDAPDTPDTSPARDPLALVIAWRRERGLRRVGLSRLLGWDDGEQSKIERGVRPLTLSTLRAYHARADMPADLVVRLAEKLVFAVPRHAA